MVALRRLVIEMQFEWKIELTRFRISDSPSNGSGLSHLNKETQREVGAGH
jgi:hypothetical protein